MVDQLSPLAPVWRQGLYGNTANGAGVVFSELQPGSIVQVAAFPGSDAAVREALANATMLQVPDGPGRGNFRLTSTVFGIAPGRYLATHENEGLANQLGLWVAADAGTVTDLSHGRTVIRVAGPKAEWVLQKLFAVDFSFDYLGLGSAISTNHHDIFAQLQRTSADQFDIYVFRSFARSFWHTLCRAAEEIGYEVR